MTELLDRYNKYTYRLSPTFFKDLASAIANKNCLLRFGQLIVISANQRDENFRSFLFNLEDEELIFLINKFLTKHKMHSNKSSSNTRNGFPILIEYNGEHIVCVTPEDVPSEEYTLIDINVRINDSKS